MSKITSELLKQFAPGTPAAKRDRFLPYLNEALPRYSITTELRVVAFLATCCFESDYFKALAEYGRGKGKRYGTTYFGRGLIQNTWKAAYVAFSKYVAEKSFYKEKPDFVAHPELLETPYWAVEAACWFWERNNLNALADKGKFFAIQGLTNRGSASKRALDYDKRLAIYDKVLHYLPDNFSLDAPKTALNPKVDLNITVDKIDKEKSGKSVEILGSDAAQKTDNVETKVTQETTEETPDGTTKTSVEQNSFKADTKDVAAPMPSGSTTTATKVTIAGITVPAFVLTLVGVIQSWIANGIIDLKAIFDMLIKFLTENTRYIAYMIIALLCFLALEKLQKTVSFIINMIINANPHWHDIKVVPQGIAEQKAAAPEAETKSRWKFWTWF